MPIKFLRSLGITLSLSLFLFPMLTRAEAKTENQWIEITSNTLKAYIEPTADSKIAFTLYRGMNLEPIETILKEGILWQRFKVGNQNYWIKDLAKAQPAPSGAPKIIDSYGILNLPHRFAAKLIKRPGAKGILETYEKVGKQYLLNNTYPVSYRQDGPKNHYSDLRTVGGPVIRYMYRTLKTSMEGWNKTGKEFGVYKISYPMPHDALPHLLEGHIGLGQYNKIPVINEVKGQLLPHPHSYMGADILIHTARWGSRGCINVENELMSLLYNEDLTTENDLEIIPLVIYDEEMKAPPVGELF